MLMLTDLPSSGLSQAAAPSLDLSSLLRANAYADADADADADARANAHTAWCRGEYDPVDQDNTSGMTATQGRIPVEQSQEGRSLRTYASSSNEVDVHFAALE